MSQDEHFQGLGATRADDHGSPVNRQYLVPHYFLRPLSFPKQAGGVPGSRNLMGFYEISKPFAGGQFVGG